MHVLKINVTLALQTDTSIFLICLNMSDTYAYVGNLKIGKKNKSKTNIRLIKERLLGNYSNMKNKFKKLQASSFYARLSEIVFRKMCNKYYKITSLNYSIK